MEVRSGARCPRAPSHSRQTGVDPGLRREDVSERENASSLFDVMSAKADIRIPKRDARERRLLTVLSPQTGVDGRLRGQDVEGRQSARAPTSVIPAEAGIHASFHERDGRVSIGDAHA